MINCFEKHSFGELNHIDYHLLKQSVEHMNKLHSFTDKSVFFDVGTNAGSFVKVLKEKNYNNIHCFEPHPVLAKTTKTVYPSIIMNEMCVGNNEDHVVINIPEHSVGLSSIIERPIFSNLEQNIYRIITKCTTIDTYCKNNNIDKIDFLKIDVEGYEKYIFEGAEEMLSSHKIISGIFEVGDTLKDAGYTENDIYKILIKHHYNFYKINDTNVLFSIV